MIPKYPFSRLYQNLSSLLRHPLLRKHNLRRPPEPNHLPSGVYISNLSTRAIGYRSKVESQIYSLLRHDFHAITLVEPHSIDYFSHTNNSSPAALNLHTNPGFYPIPRNLNLFLNTLRVLTSQSTTSAVYIRYCPSDFILVLVSILIRLLPNSRSAFVTVEIPTYPAVPVYLKQRPFYIGILRALSEVVTSRLLSPLVDLYAIVDSPITTLNGKKVLSFSNGIALAPSHYALNHLNSSVINTNTPLIKFVFVGNGGCWHGLDLFLDLMLTYSPTPSTTYHPHLYIAGTIDPQLENIISSSPVLSSSTTLLGPVVGDSLSQLLSTCHIGVGFLASSRIRSTKNSPLKHRTYAAHGLPFICDGRDLIFSQSDFVFSADFLHSPVSMHQICQWAINFYANGGKRQKIFDFASHSLRWDLQFDHVAEHIGSSLPY